MLKNEHREQYQKDKDLLCEYEKRIHQKAGKEKKKQSAVFNHEEEEKIFRLPMQGKIRNLACIYIFGKNGSLRPLENYNKRNVDIEYYQQLENPVGCGFEILVAGTRAKADSLMNNFVFGSSLPKNETNHFW